MTNSMKPMRSVPRISQSLCIILLLLTGGVLSAQTHPAPNVEHPVRNVVLVHGAWADGSGWRGVYDILVKDGYNVSIVQEPETWFQGDVTAVKRILALQDGLCILVAHSYGGAVITEAGTDPSVVGLVYVAAHMPDTGEKESEDGKRFPSDLAKSGAIKKTPDGFTYIAPAQFHELFAADLPNDRAAGFGGAPNMGHDPHGVLPAAVASELRGRPLHRGGPSAVAVARGWPRLALIR